MVLSVLTLCRRAACPRADIDSPVPAPGGRPAVLVDEAAVETLTAIGFSAAAARRALQETVSEGLETPEGNSKLTAP